MTYVKGASGEVVSAVSARSVTLNCTFEQLRLLERVLEHGSQDYPTRDAREDAEMETLIHIVNNARRHAESSAPRTPTPKTETKAKRHARQKVA